MAGISSVMMGRGDPRPTHIERVSLDHAHQTLALLLTGQTGGQDRAVDQFLEFSHGQNLDLTHLWAVVEQGRPTAAALLVPSAGRTAMLFTSPIRGRAGLPIHIPLIERVCQAQEGSDLSLIQSLLDPHQVYERRALAGAHFEALATLVYMQRSVNGGDRLGSQGPNGDDRASMNLGDPAIRIVPFKASNRRAFARAIEASYVGTRDCPALVGVRDIDDVIDGHMATGRFDPALWHAFYHSDDPVGVMLINETPPRQAVELVYLGLSAAWRGKGLGRRLLSQALNMAAGHGASSMVLAVDEHNEPALRLYREFAFRPTARKTAMIRTL